MTKLHFFNKIVCLYIYTGCQNGGQLTFVFGVSISPLSNYLSCRSTSLTMWIWHVEHKECNRIYVWTIISNGQYVECMSKTRLKNRTTQFKKQARNNKSYYFNQLVHPLVESSTVGKYWSLKHTSLLRCWFMIVLDFIIQKTQQIWCITVLKTILSTFRRDMHTSWKWTSLEKRKDQIYVDAFNLHTNALLYRKKWVTCSREIKHVLTPTSTVSLWFVLWSRVK